ncbi:TadE/TadG family type IV pilus assembly protein [Profundibacter sp.]
MTHMLRNLRRHARRLRDSESGNATIQFAIMFPIFLTLFLSSFEFGILMLRQTFLERSVDSVVRELRLGQLPNPTHDTIRTEICNRAPILPDCMETLMVELRVVSTVTWTPLATDVVCKDKSIDINVTPPGPNFVNVGAANEMVLVRACSVFKPIFPTTQLGMSLKRTDLGGYALVANSAFVNEPR